MMESQKCIVWIILLLSFFIDVHAFINVRLESENGAHEGSVEITTNGYDWEILCGSSDFDIYDVIVICRQLGYPGANQVFTSSPYLAGNYPTSSTGFLCTGNETRLNNCPVVDVECVSRSVAGAVCYTRDSGYLGCFNSAFTDPVLSAASVQDSSLTMSRCVSFCQILRFAYAGLQYGIKCLCGTEIDAYDQYGKSSDAECNYPCGGSAYETCGGYIKVSVFRALDDVTTNFAATVPVTNRTSNHSRLTPTQVLYDVTTAFAAAVPVTNRTSILSRLTSTQVLDDVTTTSAATVPVTNRTSIHPGLTTTQAVVAATISVVVLIIFIVIIIVVYIVRKRQSTSGTEQTNEDDKYMSLHVASGNNAATYHALNTLPLGFAGAVNRGSTIADQTYQSVDGDEEDLSHYHEYHDISSPGVEDGKQTKDQRMKDEDGRTASSGIHLYGIQQVIDVKQKRGGRPNTSTTTVESDYLEPI